MDATASPRASTAPIPLAPAVAAAAALTLGVTQILHTQTVPFASAADHVIEGAYALYLVAAVAAVLALRRVHGRARGWGRTGDAGALLYGLGHALVAVPVTTTFLLGHDAPDPLGVLFVPGIALWMAGLVLLAIACFRHGTVPRPVAAVLPATLPLTMALGAAGPLVEALTWAVLGVSIARAARRRAR
ncbi:hypothetical protein F5972_05750 [Microbispora cellulosiformans]|uniref:Uncharacterized protein n=1 Tax=Microbispora cellulosiformans TaxID=2614688 RepID=A0A5J5K775_9ACTN|nr:hypothetical protein [Microbispora cellulosiformans]KAA9380625.1 hypothetical protein F5972_05750 [Microbispora cellulosiformans]